MKKKSKLAWFNPKPLARHVRRFTQFARKVASHPQTTLVWVAVLLFFAALNWRLYRSQWTPSEPLDISAFPATSEQPFAIPYALPMEVPPIQRSSWDFFKPEWTAMQPGAWDKDVGIPAEEGTVEEAALRRLVQDPEHRLLGEFEVTREIRDRVVFWMRVQAQYNSQFRIIHDRHNPSVIYGVADFSPLFRSAESKGRALTLVWRHEQQILKTIRAKLSEAAGLTRTRTLAPWERSQLRAFLSKAGALDATRAAELVRGIRSQSGQRDEIIAALTRSEDILPYIEATFKTYGLPTELGRIPFVESSFNVRAHSKVGAVGMWQFMPVTARQMIHPTRTELWGDPLRQTRAAARMLLIFRSLLPDWSTTVTAYNSGVGRLQRLSRRYGVKNVAPLLEVQDSSGLGFAGKNFYAQFLSANLVEAYQKEIFPLKHRVEQHAMLAFDRPKSFVRRFQNSR
ncbi:transglycosylase SLT domain-containing protein [bacterium]|nr:transglycosylase SLT domain-containing protein [bacterium]